MPEEDILAEVRCVREEIARECNFDVGLIFERYRKAEARLKAEGWKFVNLSAQHIRETPAPYGGTAEPPTPS
jgi:hypothetical protein